MPDILIVGGGPAGLAAASECGETVLDDNPSPGGQIWRGENRGRDVKFVAGARVVAAEPGLLRTEAGPFRYDKLILATGARELFLPFPGWTLPNSMGAGGLQSLVKGGMPIENKRVVVAGSGPLLLAVGAYLRKRGADVRLVAEQAPFLRVAWFGLSKMFQALALKRGLRYRTSCWPVEFRGNAVVLNDGSVEPCDYLACGFGLVPNTELAQLLGVPGPIVVNEVQESAVKNLFSAGEMTGIGGLEKSLVEGRIAGLAAAGKPAEHLFAERARTHRFAASLSAFDLRDELRRLPRPDTIVCRCEDVTLEKLLPHRSWREAKLQTRCGMGLCQGRICGPATNFLFGWRAESTRPPLFPVSLERLSEK